MVVLERLLETMTMMTAILDGLRRRRHHDVRMAVAVVAMGAMRVLDDFEQPVHVGFRIVVMTWVSPADGSTGPRPLRPS